MHNQKILTPLCLIGKWAYLVHWWYWYMYIFKAIRSTGTIQNFWILTVYRTVSIKRPRLIFFQKSLLNVRYDRKNEGLNILSTRSYNRVVRVVTTYVLSIFWKAPRTLTEWIHRGERWPKFWENTRGGGRGGRFFPPLQR